MEIVDNSGGNRICGDHSHIAGRVEFIGSGNELVLSHNITAQYVDILLAGGSRMYVGPHCSLGQFHAYLHKQGRLRLGGESGFGAVRFLMHEPSECCVGNACLFSVGIDVTTSDMHSILDLESGKRINHSASIFIGSRVWLGKDALVLKGARIGSGSVIGARSVVAKTLPSNVVAVGSPARVVRENVNWKFDLVD